MYPMQNTLHIARRQFTSYFNSPIAYIVVCVILLITGFFFWQQFFLDGRATVRVMWTWLTWCMVVGAPALSMGLIAEEKGSGTIELLLTLPVQDWEVILGKYLGVLALYGVLLLITLPYPLSVQTLGDLDWGQVFTGYLGMFLQGAAMLALGLVASAFTDSQIIAFFVALLLCFVLAVVDKVLPLLPASISNLAEWLSFDFHRQSMARGVIDTRDLSFFVTAIGLPLLIAFRTLESRRWR